MYPKMSKTWLSMLALLGFALVSSGAFAQGNANLVGTVTDPTGALVPNAKVTITNEDTASSGTLRRTPREATAPPTFPMESTKSALRLQGSLTTTARTLW